ncbi:MAG: DUF2384 domain-containing protein [Salinisphaera sp.]|nr:DUF2384 domain-containing protein [Salinisphaera sp.]
MNAVISVLGLKDEQNWSLLSFGDALERGLPLDALTRLQALLGEHSRTFTSMIVTAPTLKRRRQKQEPLSSEESQRLQRAARVWTLAINVYGEEDNALAFLTRPHMLLDGRQPLAVAIATDVGTEAVEDILDQLKHGTAA